jgi:hypothetical protein
MKSEWIAITYEGSEIKVTNGWFTGEKLFINELQDEQLNFITPSQMTGKLKTKMGRTKY